MNQDYRAHVIEGEYRRILDDLRDAKMYGEPVDLDNPKEVAVAVYLSAYMATYRGFSAKPQLAELHEEAK